MLPAVLSGGGNGVHTEHSGLLAGQLAADS